MKRHLATLAAAIALTLVAATAWAYWSAGSATGGGGAAAASSVNQGATPTASAAGSTVTVSWAASTLANGDPVSGYLVKRYGAITSAPQTIGSACTGTITATSCVESNVPNGSWKYAVTPLFATNWQGPESARSATVTVSSDSTPPTNSITLSSVSGGAHLSGTTIYYRGTVAGSVRLTNTVADAGSGPASSETGPLTGTSTGWTHTPSTVSTPAGGPYVSNPFSWTAGTTSTPLEAVTGRDVAGNSAVTNLTFANDSTAPTAGTITYTNGFASGRSVSVSFTTGNDGLGSGIATRRLQRATATLNADQTCGTFGGWNNIGADGPTSPYVDSSLASACYQYRYVVSDRVGNQHTATSASVVKIGYAGAVNATTGLLSHWRLGESGAAVATDSFTGANGTLVSSRAGELGTTWTYRNGTDNEQIIDNRITSTDAGRAIYTASVTPSSPDYAVEADLFYKGVLAGDMSGVIGRASNTATPLHYMARYEQADQSWNLVKYSGTTPTYLAYVPGQALTVGQTYRLRLEMTGTTTTTLRLFVNGILTVLATDSTTPITGVGLAGFMEGENNSTTVKSTAAGLHLDNFKVVNLRAADSKGTNHGAYVNGVAVAVAGALASDTNTAARFDGVDDYVQVSTHTGIPVGATSRSVEAWFKTTGSARQVLFRYGSGADSQEFGLWLNSGGTTMTAWGFGGGHDKTFTMPYAVNDGAWHHVVKVYNGTTLTLYIDGVALPAQAATRNTVMDSYGFGIGAVLRPGDGNSGGYFNGWIDEVSFYTTALTQATVTDHYELGKAPAPDVTGPTGGSVDASGLVGTGSRYSTSTTLNVVLSTGTDPSGIASSGNQLRWATATLTNGNCGTFGSYTLVTGGTDPVSPKSDTVTDQACYSYEYVVLDNLGNATTYTSPNIKVDTTAPAAPGLAYSGFTNTHASGSTVHYRSAAASGSFTVTATAADSASGVASYAFPALGTNWTSTPGALGVNTYSWAGIPAAPGTKNVTASNNAGLASPNATFTMTADNTAPTAGTVTYADTTQTGTSVNVSFTTGTDSGSGIGTRLLQRASAPLTGSTCGTYGAFASVAGGTNPASPFADTVPTGQCHKYQYVVSDNVGNTDTATSTNVVKVPVSCGSQLLGNGGFENGADATPWVESPSDVVTNSGSVGAHAGSWKALLGGQGTDTTETLSQVVTIPANCTATLSYYLRVTTAETSGPFDFFRLQAISGATTTLQTFSDRDLGGSYVQRTVDLSAYAGQTITLRFLSDEDSSVQTSFWVDDVTINTAALSYVDTVNATAGLVSHYRLGEAVVSADSMAGTAGATLQSRNGETGASWTKHAVSSGDAVITPAGRVRKNGTNLGTLYYASGAPASANYTVEADIHVASNVTDDMAGVVGRLDPSNANGTYYYARYEQTNQVWVLYKVVNGTWTWLGQSATQALTAGTTYRLALDLTGSTIMVLVNGQPLFAVADGSITAAGRGGVALGFHGSASTTLTDSTGFHVDNFRISPQMADAKGTNHGDFFGGVVLGVIGAIVGDASTAAAFDGSNDFATIGRPVADDFSVELWFKSTQGIGTGVHWWSGAGLVDGEVSGSANDFGVSLRSDGKLVAGIGTPDVSIISTSGGYNDGAWHHVVFTRTKATGALALYVDGVAAGTATGASTASLTGPSSLSFGRIQSGNNYLVGSLDEVAIYNTVLSAATVSAHHAAGTSS